MKLVIGNKNYSSWSLRAWAMLEHAGVPYEEILVAMYTDAGSATIARHSPSKKVPTLVDDDIVVWDSLAIAEYLAERFPAAELWPSDRRDRATARSLCAEMHSGFTTMRSRMSMDLRRRGPAVQIDAALGKDIERMLEIWAMARGPFMFESFGAVDAFFLPVATRFRSYGVTLEGAPARYAEALLGWGPFQRWDAAAASEPYEIDWSPGHPVTRPFAPPA